MLLSSSLVGPKWALSLIFRVKLFISVCSVVELKFPGVGQKFKFFPSRLYSGILKECFVRLTTFPEGSVASLGFPTARRMRLTLA